jgi:hypothetical protein
MKLYGLENVRWRSLFGACAAAALMALALTGVRPVFGQAAPSTPASQPAQKPTAQTHPQNPELWDVEAMMEEAVQQITRRYNLNKTQENYTRLLLVGRVKVFLGEHETEVRELLRESIDLRLHPEKGTPEVYRRWAERAEPIYEAAKTAILDGNKEWGEILNEEQKKLHEADLAQMNTNFVQVGQVMADWKSGKGPGVLPNTPTTGSVSPNPPRAEPKAVEDYWLAYVTTFIQAYRLDEKQANAARGKVHADFHNQAKVYRERHRAEFDKIDADLKTPGKDARNTAPADELMRKKAELERPLRQMFVDMAERLNELLRSDQKIAADPEKKRQLEMWYNQLAGDLANKRPTSGPTSQPASQPASQPTSGPTSMPVSTSAPSPEKPQPTTTQPSMPPTTTGKAAESPPANKPAAQPATTTKPAAAEPAKR